MMKVGIRCQVVVVQPLDQGIIACLKMGEACVMAAGQGRDKLGQLASPDVKQATLWAWDALRDIHKELIKNCWRKAGILLFKVNQQYIEEKEKVSKR